MDGTTRAYLAFLFTGLVAGFLASIVLGGDGLLRYLITGVIGSFVGVYVLGSFKIDLGIKDPRVSQVVTATIGAILVILLARLIA